MRWLLVVVMVVPLFGERWSVVVSRTCCDACRIKELRLIYLKKQRRIGTCKAVPVNLPLWHTAREAFMRGVLDVDVHQWERYWSTMHFKGVNAPLVMRSPEAVAAFVRNVPGAVGWVPHTLVDDAMSVLGEFEP